MFILLFVKNSSVFQVGPGSYQIDLNTIKSLEKVQTFQFFGSTSMRFKKQEPKKYKKIKIFRNTIDVVSIKKPTIKKRLYTFKKQNVSPEKNWSPGPNHYDPNVIFTKKKTSTHSIANSARFSDNRVKDETNNKQSKLVNQNIPNYLNMKSFCENLNTKLKSIKKQNQSSVSISHRNFFILQKRKMLLENKAQGKQNQKQIRAWSRQRYAPLKGFLDSLNLSRIQLVRK